MTATAAIGAARDPASRVLGSKLDGIPFSPYHIVVILVLGLVGFVEASDLALTGSFVVLAKGPLHLTPVDVRWLVTGPITLVVVGGFAASAMSDHFSRKTVMQIGVIITTFFTLLIPLVQTADQLIIVRLLTGVGLGFAISAEFPIAAELMPAQHRSTFSAIFTILGAIAITLLPFGGFLLAHNREAFQLIALPGGLALFILPPLVHFLIPESPRWLLRKDRAGAAVDSVNLMIRRCGGRVPPLTVAALGPDLQEHEELPPFMAMFNHGQLRWTVVGIMSSISVTIAYYIFSFLLPKALVDQGAAVSLSFGLSSLLFLTSIPGKVLTGYLMETIGRRWTITYGYAGSIPGLLMMALAHLTGSSAPWVFGAGAVITGFTVMSVFPAARMYLAEQFPTALRGRGHIFGEMVARLVGGVGAPYVLEPFTHSPTIFFGSLVVVVATGALIPLLFGKETIGQLETVTEEIPELA